MPDHKPYVPKTIAELLSKAHVVEDVDVSTGYAFLQFEFSPEFAVTKVAKNQNRENYTIWLGLPHTELADVVNKKAPSRFLVHGPQIHGVVYKESTLAAVLNQPSRYPKKRLQIKYEDEGDINLLINQVTWRGEGAMPDLLKALKAEVWDIKPQPFDPFEL